ncbi:hypothetical protein KEM55_000028, partial [Ascosphaera atra]
MKEESPEASPAEVKQETPAEAATAPPGITSTGLAEETALNEGLGATLAMLKQRGLVGESNA